MVRLAQLSNVHRQILAAMHAGSRLQVQRTLDGDKRYRLVELDSGAFTNVDGGAVARLESWGLVASNMKFPTATLLLTDIGAQYAVQLTGVGVAPVGPRNFVR